MRWGTLLVFGLTVCSVSMLHSVCLGRPPVSGQLWEIQHSDTNEVLCRFRFIECDPSTPELVRPYYMSEYSLSFGELENIDSELATTLKRRLETRQIAGTFPFRSSLTADRPAFELSLEDVTKVAELLSIHANKSQRNNALEVVEISIPTYSEWVHAVSAGKDARWPAWENLQGRSDVEALQFIGRGKQLWKELKLNGEYVGAEEQVAALCNAAARAPDVNETAARQVLHYHLNRAGVTTRDDLGISVDTEQRELFPAVSQLRRNQWGVTSGFDQPYFVMVKATQKNGLNYWRRISASREDGGFGQLLIAGFPPTANDKPSGNRTRIHQTMVASGPEIRGGQENFGPEGEPIPIDVGRADQLTEEDYQIGARFVAYRRLSPTYVTTLREYIAAAADEGSLRGSLNKFDEAAMWLSNVPEGQIGDSVEAVEATVEVDWYRALAICKIRPNSRSEQFDKMKTVVASRVTEDAQDFFGLFAQRFSP